MRSIKLFGIFELQALVFKESASNGTLHGTSFRRGFFFVFFCSFGFFAAAAAIEDNKGLFACELWLEGALVLLVKGLPLNFLAAGFDETIAFDAADANDNDDDDDDDAI